MGGIVDELVEKLDNFLGRFFFAIERLVCLFISWLQQLFKVFTGISQAKYNGDGEYLVNIFFNNSTVNAIYWGMAAIGIVMAFIFAVMGVIRKGFDLDDKMRQSHGQILRSLMRSIFVILSLSLFMTITISFTNTLMDSVNKVFDNGKTLLSKKGPMTYTDEQYAAMGRVFNTVGNYSLNPSANSRYNLNSCYNEIRGYLKYLADTGVFDYYYTEDENGGNSNTWQAMLQELAVAADYNKEQPLDEYNESIANALTHCMEVLQHDNSFHALESYDKTLTYKPDEVALDRILFLCGTMGIGNTAAAKNDAYNSSPDMFDNVRAPYYTGEKSLYDLDQVNEDFHVSFSRMNYLLIYLAGTAIIVNMAVIIVNCIVRIFNLLFLYVIAPPIIAVSPLDDGGKFKQWLTAFIVQAFSVFATVISMRIFLIFIPIVMNPDLQLVDNTVISTIGKLVMIWAGTVAIEKANGLLTGILADSAGWQSIMAGSAAQDVKGSTVGKLASAAQSSVESAVAAPATWAAGKAAGIAKGVASGVGRVATLPLKPITGAVKNFAGNVEEGFGAVEDKFSNAIVESNDSKQRQTEAQNKAQERQENQQFRQMVGGYIASQSQGQGQNNPPPPARPNMGQNGGAGGFGNQLGGAGDQPAGGSAGRQGQRAPLDAKTQKFFGTDAYGNRINTNSNAAKNLGGSIDDPRAGKQSPIHNPSKAQQSLFGLDEQGRFKPTNGSRQQGGNGSGNIQPPPRSFGGAGGTGGAGSGSLPRNEGNIGSNPNSTGSNGNNNPPHSGGSGQHSGSLPANEGNVIGSHSGSAGSGSAGSGSAGSFGSGSAGTGSGSQSSGSGSVIQPPPQNQSDLGAGSSGSVSQPQQTQNAQPPPQNQQPPQPRTGESFYAEQLRKYREEKNNKNNDNK